MKYNHTTLLLLVLFSGCTYISSKKDTDASTTEKVMTAPSQNTIDDCEWTKIYSFDHLKTDTQGYSSYQTFDEFSMQGKGRATTQPYVMVKRIKDTIVVKSSLSIDSMRVYYKLPCGTWYSHMEYEMWKKMDVACKCEEYKPARTYDRYFYNDTIVEIETGFIEGKKYPRIIVKTPKEIFAINSSDIREPKRTIDHKFRSYVYDMIHSATKNVSSYKLTESSNLFSYESEQGICVYQYYKKAYGLWGIQPGIDETRIYSGQDIRNFTHSHPNGIILGNDTMVYELADQMPKYPGGIDELTKITHVTIHKQNPSTDTRIRVIVECIVEKDGSLSNIRIKRASHSEYDKKALDIVKNINRFTPAVHNGEKIRCKILIPITYSFN